MNYNEAVEFINSAAVFGSKLGLENIRNLLGLLGNPQKNMKIVHVAGTNGKGSVCAYITGILMASGYRTGLFTSPYIEKFTERIQVDLKNIPDENLIEYVGLLKEKIKVMTDSGMNHPTFFELNTAIAFMYFKDAGCDAVVLETGLGGRLDSTNVIEDPVVSVITTIGFDHMAILGDTLGKIAYEKAGIIKNGRPVVIYGNLPQEAENVIRQTGIERNSKVVETDFASISDAVPFERGYVFNYKNYEGLRIKMLGRHQINNACVAVEAAEVLVGNGFDISGDDIRKGLADTRWPGRIEIISEDPMIICDATHNPEGAGVLRKALDEIFPGKRIIFVMGVMKDKDYERMAAAIIPGAAGVVTVRPNWHRALDAEVLLETVRRHCTNVSVGDTIEKAMEKALEMAGENGIVCTTGSLYYIGDVKRFVRERFGGVQ
ncbi:MAG: folylpolyglutamate synthase/dihydrofolate synthase family protein [Clostridia bacterium]